LSPAPRRAWLADAAAIAVFVALACFQIAPVLDAFSTRALGHPGNDVWNHIWGFGYVAGALEQGRLPVHTDLLIWPTGGSLWFIDTLGAVLTLPINWAAGPVAAYNASYLLNFILAGTGAYLLALSVSGTRTGALLAGVAFQTTPHLLGQAYNGITETLAVGWLPLALLAMRWAARGPSIRRGAAAGLMLSLCALANWYYGLFAGMALIGLLVRGGWRALRKSEKPPPEVWWALATAVLVGGIVVAPPFLAFRQTMAAADAVVTRDPAFVWATLVLHNMTDALTLVHPGKYYSPDLKAQFGEDLIVVIYLGHALLWPALAVLLTRLRSRATSWAWLALGFLVLTLGPFLFVGGDYVEVMGGWMPLPFLGLHYLVPMFSRISHAYRFVIGISLALAVMIALTVRYLRIRGWSAWVVVLLLGGLRIGEALYGSAAIFPLPTVDARVPAVTTTLEGGAVLDLPIGVPVLARSRYSLDQLVHNQPVPYGLNDPVPKHIAANHFTRFLVELEWSNVHTLPTSLPWVDLELGRQAAIGDGLRWIVLHEERFPAPIFARMSQFLDVVATPVHHTEGRRIYRLDP
jgi:hypothetical protein